MYASCIREYDAVIQTTLAHLKRSISLQKSIILLRLFKLINTCESHATSLITCSPTSNNAPCIEMKHLMNRDAQVLLQNLHEFKTTILSWLVINMTNHTSGKLLCICVTMHTLYLSSSATKSCSSMLHTPVSYHLTIFTKLGKYFFEIFNSSTSPASG